jgi:hypothetical protein
MLHRSRVIWLFSLTVLCLVSLVRADGKFGKPATDTSAPVVAGPRTDRPATGAADELSQSAFIRVLRDEEGVPQALDTAIVSYVPAGGDRAGLRVDLIGAVHIGEREYYQELNKRFADYDVVLYELVAPEGALPGDGEDRSPLAMLQGAVKDMLELDFQLEEINYTRENFVHADMSPEEFSDSMQAKGEDFMSILSRLMAEGMLQQEQNQGPSLEGLLEALLDENRGLALKRVLAGQFEHMDSMMEALEGPDGSTIIAERNKVALGVLQDQIAAGKLKIGIFYGAGHMPDLERRLRDDFQLVRDNEVWLTAWDMSEPAGSKPRGSKPPKRKSAREFMPLRPR